MPGRWRCLFTGDGWYARLPVAGYWLPVLGSGQRVLQGVVRERECVCISRGLLAVLWQS